MRVSLTVGQSLSGISQTAPVRSVLMAGAVFALAARELWDTLIQCPRREG